jgi:hypothetical protein
MKPKVKMNIPRLDGNEEKYVTYYNSHLDKYISRRKVIPKPTVSNAIMQEIFDFAKRIIISEEYKEDCRKYIQRYNRKNRSLGKVMSTWPNVFLKIMRALLKEYPNLDLKKLTKEEIIKKNLPCCSITSAIEAGYLEKVRDWQKLTALI